MPLSKGLGLIQADVMGEGFVFFLMFLCLLQKFLLIFLFQLTHCSPERAALWPESGEAKG